MKTVVLGASDNPERYAYKATKMLLDYGHEVVLVGNKKGQVLGLDIKDTSSIPEKVDTLTLYVGPQNQQHYIEYIKAMQPRRVIFNPGTENIELETELEKAGIGYEEACTLVLLNTNQF